jgi:hypothetical protein
LILENGGGDSPLGGGGRHTSGTGNSAAGRPYGGGGSGTCVNTGSAPLQNSVASVPGVVIVENIF